MSEWNKYFITPEEFHNNILKLAAKIPKGKYEYVYPIPRGGLIIGVYLSHYLELEFMNIIDFHLSGIENNIKRTKKVETQKILIVDDLVDTGLTLEPLMKDGFDIATIYYKPRSIVKPTYYIEEIPNYQWVVFPFEKSDEIPNREV